MRKLISVLVCAAMILAVLCVPVLADSEETALDITDTVKCTPVTDLYNEQLPIVREDAVFIDSFDYVNDTTASDWAAPGSSTRNIAIDELPVLTPFDGHEEFWFYEEEGITYFTYPVIWSQIITPMEYTFTVPAEDDYEFVVVGCGQIKPGDVDNDAKDRGFCVSVDGGRKQQVNISDTLGAFAEYIYEYTPTDVKEFSIEYSNGTNSAYYVPCYYSNIVMHLEAGEHTFSFFGLEYSGTTDLSGEKLSRINYAGTYVQRALSEEELAAYKYGAEKETAAETAAETAPEETAAEPAKPTLEKDNVINLWDADTFGKLFTSGNQTEAALTEEGLVLTYTGDETVTGDPFFTFPIANYYKKVTNDAPKPEAANWVVFKVKCTGGDGTFELFTATPAGGDSSTGEYTADGEWHYVMIDMSLTTLVEGRKLSTMRMDWSGGGVTPGATMTVAEVGFFTEEKEACEYCGIEYETMAPRTKAPATEAPTEAPTEVPTEPATEAPKSGCGAVAASAAAVVIMAAAAAVALGKKH